MYKGHFKQDHDVVCVQHHPTYIQIYSTRFLMTNDLCQHVIFPALFCVCFNSRAKDAAQGFSFVRLWQSPQVPPFEKGPKSSMFASRPVVFCVSLLSANAQKIVFTVFQMSS